MGDVQRYQHIGSLCRSTEEMTRLYPWATQYVKAEDFDALEVEAQALREEIAAYENGMRSLAFQLGAGGFNAEKLTAAQLVDKVRWGVNNLTETQGRLLDEIRSERDELRARVVVVPERLGTTTSQGLMDVMTLHHHLGWNACLDELARLNGKAVSEGLLRRITEYGDDFWFALDELKALLDGEPT